MSALIVQWLGHLVVAEKTWVRFPLGAHNSSVDNNLTEKRFSNWCSEPPLALLLAHIPLTCLNCSKS